jgi:predicted phage terminase large subunit-like protein
MEVTEAQVIASITRSSLAEFMKHFWHVIEPGTKLLWNWHIQLACDELQRAYERVFKGTPKKYDLLNNQPPGTTKSIVHSVMAPAWAWTRMPHFAFLGASYGHKLALKLGMKTRDIVTSPLYKACFPHIILREDQNTKEEFKNTLGGVRASVGSHGTPIGTHYDVICIDDPIDPEGSQSDADLYHVNYWIRHGLYPRKKDKLVSFVDMVMQRLAQDDPSGQMLRKDKNRVRHICLPATTEFPIHPPELSVYYKDGLLDPVRLPKEYLDEVREPMNLGEDGYAGQMGQQPVPAGGGLFKVNRLRWGPVPERFKRIVRFWDNASTKKRRSKFTVGVKLGQDYDGRYWVLNVVRGQWDTAERENIKLQAAREDGFFVKIGQEEEPGSSGIDSSTITVKKLAGYRVKFYKARGSKEERATAFSTQVNGGNVWISHHFRVGNEWVGWAKEYVEELKYWPVSTFMDQGDASAGAFGMLCRGPVKVGVLPKRSKMKSLKHR